MSKWASVNRQSRDKVDRQRIRRVRLVHKEPTHKVNKTDKTDKTKTVNDLQPPSSPDSANAKPHRNILTRLASGALAIVAVVWLFLEEWLWDNMLAAMAWLAKLPPIRWLETQFAKLPPYAALVAFLIPAAVLLPFKLFAFWLIAHHHHLLGVQVFIIAKVVGTALLARIFALTKHALLTIGWFRKAYEAVTRWKAQLYAYVKSLPMYAQIAVWKNRLKARLASMWR